MTAADPLLQPFQLRHLTLRNRIMSTGSRAGLRRGRQAEAALPALPRGEGEGRDRPVDVRRIDERRAGFAAGLRPAVRRRRRHHPVVPAAGRPDARPRRGDDGPAHPHGPPDGLGRRRLAADDLGVVRPRAGPPELPQGDGGERHPAGRRRPSPRPPGAAGTAGWTASRSRPTATSWTSSGRPSSTGARDRYGGSLANRLRFSIEVLEAIRTAVGDDFIVGIRMVGVEDVDGRPDRGRTASRSRRTLARTGTIDFINIVKGSIATDEAISHVIPGHRDADGPRAPVRRPVPRAGEPADLPRGPDRRRRDGSLRHQRGPRWTWSG